MFGAAHKVYTGYGNVTYIDVYKDITTEESLDLSGATNVKMCIGTETYDSTTHPTEIQWQAENAGDPDERWVIEAKIGLLPGLPVGEQTVTLIVYDTEYTNGLVVDPELEIEVIEVC